MVFLYALMVTVGYFSIACLVAWIFGRYYSDKQDKINGVALAPVWPFALIGYVLWLGSTWLHGLFEKCYMKGRKHD